MFIFGKKQAITPSNGNNVLILKTNSILVSSANQPKKADPIPPSPNINPKNIPEIIPILSGFKSVA